MNKIFTLLLVGALTAGAVTANAESQIFKKKKKKADKPNYDHVVQVGESMHSIAQKYGIQIKSLYKMNKKHKDYIPEEGDVLKLR